MYRFLLLSSVVLFVLPSVGSLKCFSIPTPTAITTTMTQGTETECAAGVFTCSKTVDRVANTVTKACGAYNTNCTTNSVPATVTYDAICYNNTYAPTTTNCCCYGDRCNSAVTAVSSIFMMMIAYLVFSH